MCIAAVAFVAFTSRATAQADHSQQQHQTQSNAPTSTTAAGKNSTGEAEHVAPEPPQQVMGDMSYKSMVSVMQMDDTVNIGHVLFDQLEWRNTANGEDTAWDARASYGGDFNKALIKTEGEYAHDEFDGARAELLWDHIFSRWWSAQLGVREDLGVGPSRSWVAIGVEGLAPYWFDIEATAYVGDEGRSALRFDAEYDLLFTQRLILRAEMEANLYGKADPERQIGSGLSDAQVALRLRYEIRREFAPYVGIVWQKKFAGTADYAEAAGSYVSDVQAIAGIRFWF
jgi:copper resistance protein B